MRIILLTVLALLCSTLGAKERLKLEVKQKDTEKELRFLTQTSFDVLLTNTSDQAIKVVDPNKSDRFYNTHYSQNITIVNGKADSSFWFVEGAESNYSKKNIVTLDPGKSIWIYSFFMTPKDTAEHKIVINHEQMINPREAVIEALGQETIKSLELKLSTEFSFKPVYTPVTKDEFDDSYDELIAPPRKSKDNPMMSIIKYGTYSLTEALKSENTNSVYKVTVNSKEMDLARFLPILKNIRWIQFNIDNNDSIPEVITQLSKMMHLSVRAANPKQPEDIKPVHIEPIKIFNKLHFLELSNTYLKTTPEWLGDFKDLNILLLSNAFYEYTPILGQLTNLTKLHIDGKLKQDFPKEIGNLNKIKNMEVRWVYTSVPREMLTLPELETLTVSLFTNAVDFEGCLARKLEIIQSIDPNAPLTGMQNLTQLDSLILTTKSAEMPDLSNCTSLKYIKFTNSVITEFPEKLIHLPALEVLNIECNNISNISPKVGELKHIKHLTFFRGKIQTLPEEFANLTTLKRLVLSYNQLSSFPSVLLKMENLENIALHNNQITELPKEIGQLKNLKYLSLASNKLKSIPKEIGQLTELDNLDLPSNELSSVPKEIGTLVKLEELTLIGNKISSLPNSVFDLPSLKVLYLQRNPLGYSLKEKLGSQTKFKVHQ